MSSYVEGQINQLANALEATNFTPEDLTKLGQSKSVLAGLRGVLRGTHEIKPVEKKPKEEKPKPPKPLLGLPTDVAFVPAMAEFTAEKSFAKYRGSNFEKYFLGKVEGPIDGAALRSQPLLRSSTDPAIIAELGGYLKARVTLADFNYAKESGALRKDVVYIGYVEDEVRFPADEAFLYTNEKDEKCVLRAVHFHWGGGDWDADAYSVEDPDEWPAGRQILSRNSVA